jgi:hypothetical protein
MLLSDDPSVHLEREGRKYGKRCHARTARTIVDAEISDKMSAIDRIAALHRLAGLAIASGDTEALALLAELTDGAMSLAERERDARIAAARAARDIELRQAAVAFQEKPVTKLHTELSRYITDTWPRDRLVDEMPARYAGTLKAHFFRAMKAHPRAPGRRQLANIVGKVGNAQTLEIASDVDHDHAREGGQHVSEIHERGRRRANGRA